MHILIGAPQCQHAKGTLDGLRYDVPYRIKTDSYRETVSKTFPPAIPTPPPTLCFLHKQMALLQQMGDSERATKHYQHDRNTSNHFPPNGGQEPGGRGGGRGTPSDHSDPNNAFYPVNPAGRNTHGIGEENDFSSPASTASRESDGDPAVCDVRYNQTPTAPVFTQFSVEVSYLEIYNETLRDLFNSAAPTAGEGGTASAGGGGGGGGGGGVAYGGGLRLREDPRYIHIFVSPPRGWCFPCCLMGTNCTYTKGSYLPSAWALLPGGHAL